MPLVTNTFNKLNRDIALSKYPTTDYYDALNVHVMTHEGLSSGSVENDKGNTLLCSIPNTNTIWKIDCVGNYGYINIKLNTNIITTVYFNNTYGGNNLGLYECLIADPNVQSDIAAGYYKILYKYDKVYVVGLDNLSIVYSPNMRILITNIVPQQKELVIVGLFNIRDWYICFTTSVRNTSTSPTNTYGQIWKFQLDSSNNVVDAISNVLVPSKHLVANTMFNFSSQIKIDSFVGKFFSDDVIKIYFADGYNFLRSVNIMDEYSLIKTADQFEIISNITLTKPQLVSVNNGGSYNSGIVQYVYHLYNVNGNESAFSPITNFIHLTESDNYSSNSEKYLASDETVLSKKSVTITLEDLDIKFQSVRTVAIYYPTNNAVPEIRIIDERNIPESQTVTIIDDGLKNLGTYTSQELLTLGTKLFVPETIAVKDEILFSGNNVEDVWSIDYDARAYRFKYIDSNWWGKITHNNNEYEINNGYKIDLNGNSSFNDDIPETFDCILTKLKQYSTVMPSTDLTVDNYAYNQDGELGGQGPNVKYRFKLIQPCIENLGDDKSIGSNIAASYTNDWIANYPLQSFTANNSYSNYASPILRESVVGYQRDEVYRFGIVLYDIRGRRSDVKWIGDIKMPAIYESDSKVTYSPVGAGDKYDFSIAYQDTHGNNMNILYVEFEVTNLPTEVYAYEIVRVKRENSDKTITAQGIITASYDGGTHYYPPFKMYYATPKDSGIVGNVVNAVSPANNILLDIMSPEINFGDVGGDSLQLVGLFDEVSVGSTTTYSTISNQNYFKANELELTSVIQQRDILQFTKATPSSESEYSFDILPNPYIHYTYQIGVNGTYKGTSGKINVGNSVFTSAVITGLSSDRYVVGNIIRNLSTQYGGNTYSEKSRNEYLSTGAYIVKDSRSYPIAVFGGDTYVAYYDYLRCFFDLSSGGSPYQEICYFPVETCYNIDIREKCFHNKYKSYLLQEVSGEHTNGGDSITQTNDLYDLNLVYSKQNELVKYFPKPINFTERTKFDTRILASEKQLNTINDIDYWTKFLYNNYIDIDSSYGAITKLEYFKNRLFVFLENAFGVASVNERSSVTTTAGNTLAVGDGGILPRFDFITTTSGTVHKGSVINTGEALHFFDIGDKKWYRYTGQSVEPESVSKLMSGWFKSKLSGSIKTTDSLLNNIGVVGTYDKNNMRVLMTFLNGTDKFTISFNELTDAFESYHSFLPAIYLNNNDILISRSPVLTNELWLHGNGEYGKYYGTVYPCYITTVVAPNYDLIKVFTNIEYNTECYNNSLDQYLTTFDSIKVWNEYQDSGEVLFIQEDNLRRRFRQWWAALPRDAEDTRFRSQSIFLKLTFNNVNNNRLVFHNLNTFFI